jgi:hypothetical protein
MRNPTKAVGVPKDVNMEISIRHPKIARTDYTTTRTVYSPSWSPWSIHFIYGVYDTFLPLP